MSNYSRNQIREYGIREISKILPLDYESLSQMVDYVLDNIHTRDEMAKYFTELIGDEPDCLVFMMEFQDMVFGKPKQEASLTQQRAKSVVVPKEVISTKKQNNAWGAASAITQDLQKKKQPTTKPRLAKQAESTTTSQLIDKKLKKTDPSKASKKRTLKNLQDISSALSALEISGAKSVGTDEGPRICNCMATRHPLFEFYPNCLNCGRIICAKEGLQPCAFCGKDLLSAKEREEISQILRSEKTELEGSRPSSPSTQQHIQQSKRNNNNKKVTLALNAAGEQNWKKQDALFKKLEKQRDEEAKSKEKQEKEIEELKEQEERLKYFSQRADKDPELLKAQERLDNLLNFQDTGAERTKIIDRSADFDMPNGSGSLWASPMERALQLKRQQRQLRKQEEDEKERSGRGRRVLDMSIRDGKVIMREAIVKNKAPGDNVDYEGDYVIGSDDEEDLKQIRQLQSDINKAKIKEEGKKMSSYWDYEKDKDKWQKPVYLNDDTQSQDDPHEDQEDYYNKPGERVVQMTNLGETEEDQLISLPTL